MMPRSNEYMPFSDGALFDAGYEAGNRVYRGEVLEEHGPYQEPDFMLGLRRSLIHRLIWDGTYTIEDVREGIPL